MKSSSVMWNTDLFTQDRGRGPKLAVGEDPVVGEAEERKVKRWARNATWMIMEIEVSLSSKQIKNKLIIVAYSFRPL